MFFDSLIVRASCAEISVWSFEMSCVATLTVSSADLPACCENWDLKLAEILHRVRDWLKTQVPEFYLSVNVTYSESQMLCFISAYRNQEVGCINIDPERWNRKCQEIGIHVPVIKLWLFSPGLHILVFRSLNLICKCRLIILYVCVKDGKSHSASSFFYHIYWTKAWTPSITIVGRVSVQQHSLMPRIWWS